LAPAMTIAREQGGERTITWDPATKLIKTDGAWSYKISPPENRTAAAAIERANTEGKTELWDVNSAKGITTTREQDGVTKVFSWFTSGKLAGLPRSVVSVDSGKTETVTDQWSYDESARLLRLRTNSAALSNIDVRARQPEDPKASATVQVEAIRKDGSGAVSYTVQAARGHMVRAD
jgi:hypothetical protein